MNQKQSLLTAAILGAITVMIGAFGAHTLRPTLEATGRLETFETAVKYQMYHTLSIFLIGLLQFHLPLKQLRVASLLLFLGILIFSGSLYVLCLSGITVLGAITPFGGVLFIVGWLYVALGLAKLSVQNN